MEYDKRSFMDPGQVILDQQMRTTGTTDHSDSQEWSNVYVNPPGTNMDK